MKITTPPIKSQGIKSKLVPWINTLVPEEFTGTWIEPFMGTGVVGFNIAKKRALMCDSNPHLINFYEAVKNGKITPDSAKAYLVKEGQLLRDSGKDHYNFVRARFNETADPLDFLFVNRSGFNGMIRFNKKGGFNIPFCHKPNRFAQAYVTRITNQIAFVRDVVSTKHVTFIRQNFLETISAATEKDIIYCDPPYIGRHVDYFNGWNEENEHELFNALKNTKAKFILSTWHHNDFRENTFIPLLWNEFNILTREHFYHVGGHEKNRNPMIEAIVTNLSIDAVLTLKNDKKDPLKLL